MACAPKGPQAETSRSVEGVPIGLLASFRDGPKAGFRPIRDIGKDAREPLEGFHYASPMAPAPAGFVRASTL